MILKARKFSETDILIRVNWINDKRINESMTFELPATFEKTLIWYKNNVGNPNRIDFTITKCNNDIVSMGGFISINRMDSNAEFYIMVNPEMMGQGFGSKISAWLFNYAFIELELNKIYLFTNDDNINAYRIYEKYGFKLEGLLREQKFKNGFYKNRRFYGLLKSEWEKLSWSQKMINYEF